MSRPWRASSRTVAAMRARYAASTASGRGMTAAGTTPSRTALNPARASRRASSSPKPGRAGQPRRGAGDDVDAVDDHHAPLRVRDPAARRTAAATPGDRPSAASARAAAGASSDSSARRTGRARRTRPTVDTPVAGMDGRRRVVVSGGMADHPLPEPAVAKEWLATMLLIRRFEERAGEQYARAKIGGFLHLAIGEEATIVGTVRAMRDDRLPDRHLPHARPRARARHASRTR